MASGSSKVVEFGQPWRRHLQRGMAQLRHGHYHDADKSFARALAEAPDEPEVLLAVGRERIRQGRYEAAQELLSQVVKKRPQSVAATAALTRVLGLHLDRREEAFLLIHSFMERFAGGAPLQVVRGELLLEEGALLDARAAFGQALDEDFADDAARMGLARTYNEEGVQLSEQGQGERAIFALKRAADLDPQWSGPWVNLGVVFGRMGKLEKAIASYEEALQRDASNPVAHFNLGTAHKELGNCEEAVECFAALLEICPEYPGARRSLANLLGELGDFDRSISLLLEEIEIDPHGAGNWSSLGLAYICGGNVQRGETCIKRALALDPGLFNAHYNLAVLYVIQKRYEEAEAALQQAFALDPQQTALVFATDERFAAAREQGRFRFLS